MKNDNSPVAVEISGINKSFRVPHEKVSSLKGHATRMFKRVPVTNYKALNDINCTVKKGEFFSIIGSNGSGKSTLLKLLAGIYEPDSGHIRHHGSMSTMIELGVGFNFELSGRDNIFLNASLFGMTRSKVEEVFDVIVSFAEIEDFIDQKIKNYSSGMQVRLAFAIAIQAQSDIMIVDEVLAVGDANFQQKCFDIFRELKAQGKTIIFVSHDLHAVQDFSDRVMLIEKGQQIGIYKPLDAMKKYQELNREELENTDLSVVANKSEKKPEIDITKPHLDTVRVLGDNTKPVKILSRGNDCQIEVVVNNPDGEDIEVGASIVRNDDFYCFGTNTAIDSVSVPKGKNITMTLNLKNLPLQQGAYYIVAGVFSKGGKSVYEMRTKAYAFRVIQDDMTEGLVNLEHSWKASSK